MAAGIFLSVPYAWARVSVWLLLLVAAAVNGFIHRIHRSRGRQTYLAITLLTSLFFIRTVAILGVAKQSGSDGWAAFATYLFLDVTATSALMAVLLAISTGFGITRSSLAPYNRKNLFIGPAVFFITSFVVDCTIFLGWVGKGAFAYDDNPDPPTDEDAHYDKVWDPPAITAVWVMKVILMVVVAFANQMAFALSWGCMYHTARAEIKALTAAPTNFAVPAASHLPGTCDKTVIVGQVANSAEFSTASTYIDVGQNASHMYGGVVSEDPDATQNMADRIAARDKATLMRQYVLSLCLYGGLYVAWCFDGSMLAPWGIDGWKAGLVHESDALLWGFMAVLLYMFRVQPGNQYLSFTEEKSDGREGTTVLLSNTAKDST